MVFISLEKQIFIGTKLVQYGTKKAFSPSRKRLFELKFAFKKSKKINTVLHLRGFCHPPSAGSDLRDHPLHVQRI